MNRLKFSGWTIVLWVILALAYGYPPQAVEAGNFRLRAREHFELLSIRYGDLNEKENYFGLTNTLNAWYEKPFHYAIGLAFGPMLGSAKSMEVAPPGTDPKIRLWNFGLEGEYFIFPENYGLFGRVGLTGNLLDTRGSVGTISGGGYYLGLGWETQIWRIGVAPELAFRHLILEQHGRLFAFTSSIGFHFYVFPKDPELGNDMR